MSWQNSVLNAIRDLCFHKNICVFTRSILISEKLEIIIKETETQGRTPERTLDRCLQDLRDQGYIDFVDNDGTYRLI